MRAVRTVLGTVGGLTLLIGLSTYAVHAYTPQAAAKASAPRAVSSQEEFDRIIIARETKIVGQLGLSPEQRRQYDALRLEQDRKTHAFRTRRPFRPEEGMELNVWWNTNVRKVFTPEQYNHYLRLWSTGPGSVAVPLRSLEQTDNDALVNLGLTPQQRQKVKAHQATMHKRSVGRQAVLQSGDSGVLTRYDAETVRINQRMKSILTAAQYRTYCAKWSASLGNGMAVSPARMRQ
jgi:hypothetical protein